MTELAWLAAALLVPLILNPWGCNAFELPKALLLQALAVLGLLAGLLEPPRQSHGVSAGLRPILWAGLACGAAAMLSTALSVDPRASLLGSFARQQGALTLLAFLVLAGLVTMRLRSPRQARRLLAALVWGSAPVVTYALLQAARLDPVPWQSDAASPILATLGRSNFLGSYLVLIIPLTVALARLSRRPWPYLLLLVGQMAVLALSHARAAWLGLAVAALTAILAWRWAAAARATPPLAKAPTGSAGGQGESPPRHSAGYWPLLAGMALVAMVSGLLLAYAMRNVPVAGGLHALISGGSSAARLTIWQAALPLVGQRPWLGYGPETMEGVFAPVYPPQLVYYQGRGTVVDRAHDLWLDLALSQGLAGLLAFIALLVLVLRRLWRMMPAASASAALPLGVPIAICAALLGHVADLQFGFDVSGSGCVFWLVLGLAAALPEVHRAGAQSAVMAGGEDYWPPRLRGGSPYSAAPWLYGMTLILVALPGLPPLLGDLACHRSAAQGQPLGTRLAAAQQSVRWWPLQPEYRLRLAGIQTASGQYAAAEAQLVAAGRQLSGSPAAWLALGDLYLQWGRAEPERTAAAIAAYRQSVALAPHVATHHTVLAAALAQDGQTAEATTELETAVALDATDGLAWDYLSRLYALAGRNADAQRAASEAARWSAMAP